MKIKYVFRQTVVGWNWHPVIDDQVLFYPHGSLNGVRQFVDAHLHRRSTLQSASSFFSSSASLIKEIRKRNIAIETTHANNSREPRARASCKHSATVHLARHSRLRPAP